MTSNQLHGKKFEDIIKSSFMGASDNERLVSAKWDIEHKFDKEKGLPSNIKVVSVKLGGVISIGMADARKFMGINEDFRLIVGLYKQEGIEKRFYEIREYIITKADLGKIKGDLVIGDVEFFHNELKTRFKNGVRYTGKEKEKIYLSIKEHIKLKEKKSNLHLNPKVDSKNQRRLQCSLLMNELDEIVQEKYVYVDYYRGLKINFCLLSPKREFNQK